MGVPRDIRRPIPRNELRRILELAELRCRSTGQLLRDLPGLLTSDSREAALFAVLERTLSSDEQQHLSLIIRELAALSANWSSRDRTRIDGSIRRLMRALPASIAAPLAEQFLDAKWKSRRMVAYSGLRRSRVTARVARRLLERYRATGDQHLLELVARSPTVAARVEPAFMLEELSEHYWRTRVVEALMRHRTDEALRIAEWYPKEFAHAAGRVADKRWSAAVRRVMRTNLDDLELLTICVYAFGKMGSRAGLREAREVANGLEMAGPLWNSSREAGQTRSSLS